MAEVRFVVEQAGCPSCAARIRGALEAVATVESIEIDANADVASVRLLDGVSVSKEAVEAALHAVSAGAGHTYSVQPESWVSTSA